MCTTDLVFCFYSFIFALSWSRLQCIREYIDTAVQQGTVRARTHSFTHRGNFVLPVLLLVCSWEIGVNQRLEGKTHAHTGRTCRSPHNKTSPVVKQGPQNKTTMEYVIFAVCFCCNVHKHVLSGFKPGSFCIYCQCVQGVSLRTLDRHG